MNTLNVQKTLLDLPLYIKRGAREGDFDTLIKESVTLVEDGKVKVIYQDLDELSISSSPIVKALKAIRYETGKRTTGLKSTSRIFGFRPRATVRKNYCAVTSLAREYPEEHRVICQYASELSKIYETANPELYRQHKAMVEKIHPEWLIANSIFTSGIVNKNNPLKYHFDTGNFNEVNSCMVVFKSGVGGGYLSLPEYGIGLELKNNSLLMFDGQGILHGVTPISYASPYAFRYSVVYYSLKQMWKCLTITEELANIKKDKTVREVRRATMTHEEKIAYYQKQGYEVWMEDGKIRVKKNR